MIRACPTCAVGRCRCQDGRPERPPPEPCREECPAGGEHVLIPSQGGGLVCVKCNQMR